jgi:hypothetical protein
LTPPDAKHLPDRLRPQSASFNPPTSIPHMQNAPSAPGTTLSRLNWNEFQGFVENARAASNTCESIAIIEGSEIGYHRIMIDLSPGRRAEGLTVGFTLRPAGRRSFRFDIIDGSGQLAGRVDAILSDRPQTACEGPVSQVALTPISDSWFRFSARVGVTSPTARIIIALRDEQHAVLYPGDGRSGLVLADVKVGAAAPLDVAPVPGHSTTDRTGQVCSNTTSRVSAHYNGQAAPPDAAATAPAPPALGPTEDERLHVLLIGLPKSANVFVRESLILSCGCEYVDISVPGPDSQMLDVRRLEDFITKRRAIGGEHIPPTKWHLDLLSFAGLDRITLLVRDPRDALVSWWHHLDRPDIRDRWWVNASEIVRGTRSPGYFSLPADKRLDALIESYYGWFQSWLRQWADAVESDRRFNYHVAHYETFVQDKPGAIKSIAQFHGIEIDPILPPHSEPVDGGIRPNTHFRRGESGSHRHEMSARQQLRVNELSNRELFTYFGWTI